MVVSLRVCECFAPKKGLDEESSLHLLDLIVFYRAFVFSFHLAFVFLLLLIARHTNVTSVSFINFYVLTKTTNNYYYYYIA